MSDNMLLTTKERERFIVWLTNQAESTKLILEQMEKLPGITYQLKKQHGILLSACLVLIKELSSYE